jgi:hypothetical protein
MYEQRLSVRLRKHWDLMRKEKAYPDFRQFNAAMVEDVWPECFLIGLDTRVGVNYKYEYMGENLVEIYGRDMTGQYIDHKVKHFPGVIVFKKLEELLRGSRPEEDGGCFTTPEGKIIKYRACFLPFGNDNQQITHIIVGLSCRMF